MKRIAVVVAIAMLTVGFAPMAAGNHLSVGNQDAVGMSPDEEPGDASVSEDRYQTGITDTGECHDSDGDDLSETGPQEAADSAVEGAESDAFCGRLDYNPGTSKPQKSPRDQTLNGDIGTWDVVYASYVGNYGLSTCSPWCQPGAITAYRTTHDVLADQGLADDGETADNRDDGGWQEYALNTLYPNALIVGQQMTNAWDMNGWAHSVHDQQFIGFLEDTDQQVIDDDRLENEIFPQHEEDLPDGSDAVVCGFTPDYEVSISATQAGFCEVLFRWGEPNDDGPGPASAAENGINSDDYSDPCESPAYVCGASESAWYAQLVCKSAPVTGSGTGCAGGWWFGGPGSAVNPALGEQPAWSDNDYDVWHWVVAPAPSDCSGDQEPGFQTTPGPGSEYPFLAHDLDVYSPAATAAGQTGTENVEDYARSSASKTLPGVETDQVPPAEELLPGQVQKADRVEPNAPGDTSQQKLANDEWTERTLGENECDELRDSSEEFADPWRDVVDNQVHLDAAGEPTGGAFDLYLNEDPTQDASNRPGYAQYFPSGKVGVFADKNDDGDYDQAAYDDKLQSVNQVGAYPMVYDVELDEETLQETGDAEAAMFGGCTPGFSDFNWTTQAREAGYGPRTGLMQVLYLNEPTYLYNWKTSEAFPFPGGDNAFVFMTDGLEELLNHGTDDHQAFVQQKIDEALAHVPADDPNVVLAHELTDNEFKDFYDQCSYGTGGFVNAWGFAHTCGSEPGGELCAGDTVVTQYTYENQAGVLGGSQIPVLDADGDGSGETFPSGVNDWVDVDPLDGDASRNNDDCNRPQHHPADHEDPCGFEDDSHHPS
jgi:hypothetical protein